MSPKASSQIVVYAALAGNLAIAIIKFVAAAIIGSMPAIRSVTDASCFYYMAWPKPTNPASAMLSEGVHSLTDTINELYFWSFIVGLLVLAFDAGVSVYEGALHLRHPQPV